MDSYSDEVENAVRKRMPEGGQLESIRRLKALTNAGEIGADVLAGFCFELGPCEEIKVVRESAQAGEVTPELAVVLLITVSGEIVVKRWDQVKGVFDALLPIKRKNHVIKGDCEPDYHKLTGGMHTDEGVEEFIRQGANARVSRVHKVVNDADLIPGVNRTEDILIHEIHPNGVRIAQLPRSGINKGTAKVTVIIGGVEYKGVKSLFPSHWDKVDMANAQQAVLSQNTKVLNTRDELYGYYKDVKLVVYRNTDTKVISSSHPTWIQDK